MVLALLMLAPAVVAEEWLRVRVSESRRDLWVDLERQRIWVDGRCDGGQPAEVFERSGGRLRIEWRDREEATLPGAPLVVEQRWNLELEDLTGSLQIDGPLAAAALTVPVRVVQRSGGPRCP